MDFEYTVIPAPQRGEKVRGARSPADRYAVALAQALNRMAGDGWEYVRAETLPSEERSGLTSRTTVWMNVLVFRRSLAPARPAAQAADAVRVPAADPAAAPAPVPAPVPAPPPAAMPPAAPAAMPAAPAPAAKGAAIPPPPAPAAASAPVTAPPPPAPAAPRPDAGAPFSQPMRLTERAAPPVPPPPVPTPE